MVPILWEERGRPAEESKVLQAGKAEFPERATPLEAAQCRQASAVLLRQVVSVKCSVRGRSQEQAAREQAVH
jgi:hypothetical protein